MAELNSIGIIMGIAIDAGVDVSKDNWHQEYRQQLVKGEDALVERMADLMETTIRGSTNIRLPDNMKDDGQWNSLKSPFQAVMQPTIIVDTSAPVRKRVLTAARHLIHACD